MKTRMRSHTYNVSDHLVLAIMAGCTDELGDPDDGAAVRMFTEWVHLNAIESKGYHARGYFKVMPEGARSHLCDVTRRQEATIAMRYYFYLQPKFTPLIAHLRAMDWAALSATQARWGVRTYTVEVFQLTPESAPVVKVMTSTGDYAKRLKHTTDDHDRSTADIHKFVQEIHVRELELKQATTKLKALEANGADILQDPRYQGEQP